MRILLRAGICLVLLTAASTTWGAIREVTVGPGGATSFSPDALVISQGDTVLWTWGSNGHTVTSGTPGSPDGNFASGAISNTGTTFSVVFDQAFLDANPMPNNLYPYHCIPHGPFGMTGSVRVVQSGIPAVSARGLIAMAVLLIAMGTVVFARIRRLRPS